MDYQKVKEVIIGRLRAELKPQLTYHNADHTLDVLEAATRLAGLENIKGHDRGLLLTAAPFPDTRTLRASTIQACCGPMPDMKRPVPKLHGRCCPPTATARPISTALPE